MADGVHAAMQPMQTATRQARVDRVLADPQLDQLRPRDHPVLPCRQTGNLGIRRLTLSFPAYLAGKCSLGRGRG